MPTLRQHLEVARDYAHQAMQGERSAHPIGGVYDHINAALAIFDDCDIESHTADGPTYYHRCVPDDTFPLNQYGNPIQPWDKTQLEEMHGSQPR